MVNSHLTLKGHWVICHAYQRACPRLFHMPGLTPADVHDLPLPLLDQLLNVIEPPTHRSEVAGTQLQWLDADGRLHRDHDLPAFVTSTGTIMWYQHGELHRDHDLPAIVTPHGEYQWYRHGLAHRDKDRPASVGQFHLQWSINDELRRTQNTTPVEIRRNGERLFYGPILGISTDKQLTGQARNDPDAFWARQLRLVGEDQPRDGHGRRRSNPT